MSLNMSLNSTEVGSVLNATENPMGPSRAKITALSLSFFSLFICVLGLVGNGIMIWLFSFKIKRTQSVVYFLNLAIADFLYLFGMGVFTCYFISRLHDVYITDSNKNIIAITSETLMNVGFDASSFLLTIISVERCASVLFPFYNSTLRPEHQSAIVCVSMWVLATLTTILEVFVCNDHGNYLSPEAQSCIPIIIFTTTLFVIVIILMLFSSMVLLIEIQKTSKFCRPPKLYIVILLTLLIFFVSIIPSRVLGLLIFFNVYTFDTHALSFYFTYSICTAINCSANPYINILVGRWGKKAPITKAVGKIFQSSN